MSMGFVYVMLSYISVVGDVRALLFEGMSVLRILACCLGSCLLLCICSVIFFRFACCMWLFSSFLHFACFFMLSGVGLLIRMLWSSCCRFIFRFSAGVHQSFLLGRGIFSCFSMARCERERRRRLGEETPRSLASYFLELGV